jgi:head-tail adaptor
MPLRPGQLAAQRERAERDLTELCEIQRYITVTNDLGEKVKTWAPVATGVACRVVAVGSVTGRERLRNEAIGQVTQWAVVLPWGQDVTSADRIYVTSQSPAQTFNVSQPLGPHTDQVRLRVLVDKVT